MFKLSVSLFLSLSLPLPLPPPPPPSLPPSGIHQQAPILHPLPPAWPSGECGARRRRLWLGGSHQLPEESKPESEWVGESGGREGKGRWRGVHVCTCSDIQTVEGTVHTLYMYGPPSLSPSSLPPPPSLPPPSSFPSFSPSPPLSLPLSLPLFLFLSLSPSLLPPSSLLLPHSLPPSLRTPMKWSMLWRCFSAAPLSLVGMHPKLHPNLLPQGTKERCR